MATEYSALTNRLLALLADLPRVRTLPADDPARARWLRDKHALITEIEDAQRRARG